MVSGSELAELVARQKCYDVITRYCRALDRADLELMKSVYWQDAIDIHGVFEGNAQEFSAFVIEGIQNWFVLATHNVCNVHMEYIDGIMYTESYLISYCQVETSREKVEEVYGPTYLSRININNSGDSKQGFLMGGRYLDQLQQRNGEWKISRREVVMDWNENRPAHPIFDEGMFKSLTRRGCYGPGDSVYANKP